MARFKLVEGRELEMLGSHLRIARLAQPLSQSELAARCGLSQAQISYFEAGRRSPTLEQLLRMARALDVSIQRFIGGSDRPGTDLRNIAIELRHLGIVDLWVKDAAVPGAFRRPEELIVLVVAPEEPEPQILEALPALLAWNTVDPILLRAYGLTNGTRTARRLAWLADIALTIDKRGGFPGGCRKESLIRFTRMIRFPSTERDSWDGLGHPMATLPKSPLWKRWRINYDANVDQFEERAQLLDELRNRPAVGRSSSTLRRKPGRGIDDGAR
jgi:transcriptional regulator with XRE-family HTH domain